MVAQVGKHGISGKAQGFNIYLLLHFNGPAQQSSLYTEHHRLHLS